MRWPTFDEVKEGLAIVGICMILGGPRWASIIAGILTVITAIVMCPQIRIDAHR